MKQVIFLGIVLSMFVGCTKYNQIDTGICKAEFPGNMYEYFQSDSYNWDSLLVMIDYTGLEKYFTGEEPAYEEITFFGPTNHSIRRWLYSLRTNMNDMGLPDSTKVKIMLQDKETCRDLILSHIIKGKRLAADFKEGTANDETSGEMVTGANGKQFRVFAFRETFQNVPGAGALVLYAIGHNQWGTTQYVLPIASSDIQPTNGVVHSMAYSFTLGELK